MAIAQARQRHQLRYGNGVLYSMPSKGLTTYGHEYQKGRRFESRHPIVEEEVGDLSIGRRGELARHDVLMFEVEVLRELGMRLMLLSL